MHAVHITLDVIGPTPAGRLERIVKDVSSRPGFLHGYWLEPRDGHAHAYAFFDTEENARAKAPTVGETSPTGDMRITGVEFDAVAATA